MLANRLSENPANKVVLLEAGGTADSFMNRLPAAGMKLLGKPETDWGYVTEPDPSLNGRQGYWSAGRLLGGGSSVNGMIYIRGDRADYDEWAANGCTGWGWDEIGRCFVELEDHEANHGRASPTRPIRPWASLGSANHG